MSSEDYEPFKELKRERQKHAEKNRCRAYEDFRDILQCGAVASAGLVLRHCSNTHYQLMPLDRSWIINVYPGNRRLQHDYSHKQGPRLALPDNWTLKDVVAAAIAEQTKEPL